MISRTCNTIAFVVTLVAALSGTAVRAQDYPVKPVRVIMPFPPGGSSDLVARFVSQGLSERLGQQFIVENRAGAAGNIGMDAVAKAAPDGYVLGYGTSGPLANNKHLYSAMPFDSDKAFTPIALVAEIPLLLAAGPGLPVTSLRELLDYARNHPGKVSAGHPGNGTIGHLAIEQLNMLSGSRLVGVPYKGDVPVITDTIAGTVQVASVPVTAMIPHVQSGKLRALAMASRARLPNLPDVPTAIELGHDLVATVWSGFVGPAGLPRPVVDKLNAEINRIIQSPDGRAQLTRYAALLVGGAPERMGELMASDSAKWKRVIEATKIVVQ